MNDDIIILVCLALLTLGAVAGFIIGQAHERLQVCHQISYTVADYDNCTKSDNNKFMTLLKRKVEVNK